MPSSNIPDFIEFLNSAPSTCVRAHQPTLHADTKLHRSYGESLNITGGGAYKFEAMIKSKLGFKVHKTGSVASSTRVSLTRRASR
jgi:hypothetical protein